MIEALLLEIGNFIRSHLNDVNRGDVFTRITTCLGNVTNCNGAFKFYSDSNFPDFPGGKYFYICGLLQSIVAQQDSIEKLLMEIISEDDWKKFKTSDYEIIRCIRNDVIGHPSGVNRGLNRHRTRSKSDCYNLGDISLWEKWKFEYMSPDCENNTGGKYLIILDGYFKSHLLWVIEALSSFKCKKEVWILKC